MGFSHPGTSEYTPPDQRPGQLAALRLGGDGFALGCMLFELLSGRMHFM